MRDIENEQLTSGSTEELLARLAAIEAGACDRLARGMQGYTFFERYDMAEIYAELDARELVATTARLAA